VATAKTFVFRDVKRHSVLESQFSWDASLREQKTHSNSVVWHSVFCSSGLRHWITWNCAVVTELMTPLLPGQPTGALSICWWVMPHTLLVRLNRPIHSQLNWAILLCDVIPDGKTEQMRSFDRQ